MSEPCPLPEARFTTIDCNGIRLRLAVADEASEEGPLMLCLHGWPESWYNWRHQLRFFAARGFRVAAPDMRGYGGSEAPRDAAAYDILTLVGDVVGMLDALGERQAILVGHDWGAIVAWHAALLHPERFSSLVAMSVPWVGRPRRSPMQTWREKFGDRFFYILYHNAPDGLAEREYDADPRGLLSRLYLSPDSPRAAPQLRDPDYRAGGWIPRLGAAKGLPDWLEQGDLDYLVGEFTRAGFRGGLNYYRNFHRNWELTADLRDMRVRVPTMFIAGAGDMVLQGADAARLRQMMAPFVPDLEDVILLPGVGHWVQQEAPEAVNEAMLAFIDARAAAGSRLPDGQ